MPVEIKECMNVVVIPEDLVEITERKRDELIGYMNKHPLFNNGSISEVVRNFIGNMDPVQLHRLNLVWRGNYGAPDWSNGGFTVRSGCVEIMAHYSRVALLILPKRSL